MKKQILLLLLTLAINIQPQEDWLKANLKNRWQFIRDDNGTSYYLVIKKFNGTVVFSDLVFYRHDFYIRPLRYDSILNCIEVLCIDTTFPHCYFNVPDGGYGSWRGPNSLYCDPYVRIFSDSFSIGNLNYETKLIWWEFQYGNTHYFVKYSNGLGIVYYKSIGRYNITDTYSLYQCEVDGIVYKDSIQIGFQINPILTITEPNFRLIFKVTHPHNKIFPVGSGKTSLLMIDTVWFYSFYEKDGDTINVEPARAGWLVGTENYLLQMNLNMGLLVNGYSFNYKIKAVDRGLEPNISYNPISGYYKAFLDSTINVNSVNNPLIDYELEQNYPNPFNSTTKIRFFVPKEDDIVIDIYDVLGQQVIRIFEERVAAGRYEVELSSDMINSINSSGVYFYRMRSSEKVISKKMLIQK